MVNLTRNVRKCLKIRKNIFSLICIFLGIEGFRQILKNFYIHILTQLVRKPQGRGKIFENSRKNFWAKFHFCGLVWGGPSLPMTFRAYVQSRGTCLRYSCFPVDVTPDLYVSPLSHTR